MKNCHKTKREAQAAGRRMRKSLGLPAAFKVLTGRHVRPGWIWTLRSETMQLWVGEDSLWHCQAHSLRGGTTFYGADSNAHCAMRRAYLKLLGCISDLQNLAQQLDEVS